MFIGSLPVESVLGGLVHGGLGFEGFLFSVSVFLEFGVYRLRCLEDSMFERSLFGGSVFG